MRNRPDAGELLEIAERTLLEDVTPDIGPHRRYTLLLVAAALGIARREIAGGPTAFPGEGEALAALVGSRDSAGDAIEALNRRFAAALRAGRFDDGPDRDRAFALLRADVEARLAEDNPRYRR